MEYKERKRWLFLGLPFTFTKYIIKEDVITMDTGLLKTVENDCYMYKVQDVQHSATLLEKMFRLGTVTCFTGDTTHPQLYLVHIKHSRDIKDFILEQSEKARLKRRTVNMLDIGSGAMQDMGDPD
ncbi:MAG: PH domain-containing protein [Acetatifactor sp.]|nr:PH domain-containing protein [Acetatifactor sp.]